MKTYAGVAARSFLSEKTLIKRRDAQAFILKWQRQDSGFWWGMRQAVGDLVDFDSLEANERNAKLYQAYKMLGSIVVAKGESPASGVDPKTGATIVQGQTHILMHTYGFRGAQQLRSDLRVAGGYIARHPEFSEQPYVMGVTHPRMGRFVTRLLPFSEMDVQYIDPDYAYDLYASVDASTLLSGREVPDGISMLYMPTDEFVAHVAQ